MSLHYHLVERTVLAGEDAGKKKFYGQVRAGNFIDFDMICNQVSKLSTANKGEVAVVLSGMIDAMVDYLQKGHIVQMGDLGNFRPSAGSRGAETEDEFSLNLMRKAKVLFSPGKEIRTTISKTGFRFLDLEVKERTKSCDKVHLGE